MLSPIMSRICAGALEDVDCQCNTAACWCHGLLHPGISVTGLRTKRHAEGVAMCKCSGYTCMSPLLPHCTVYQLQAASAVELSLSLSLAYLRPIHQLTNSCLLSGCVSGGDSRQAAAAEGQAPPGWRACSPADTKPAL